MKKIGCRKCGANSFKIVTNKDKKGFSMACNGCGDKVMCGLTCDKCSEELNAKEIKALIESLGDKIVFSGKALCEKCR